MAVGAGYCGGGGTVDQPADGGGVAKSIKTRFQQILLPVKVSFHIKLSGNGFEHIFFKNTLFTHKNI